MSYLRSGQQPQQPSYGPTPRMPEQPKSEEKPIPNINLDPTNPVETVGAAIGGLAQGVIGGVKGVWDFGGSLPVIGDVGRAIGGALGAVGEIGTPDLKVKDVAGAAGGALGEIVALPGRVVQTGAAAVRASGVFGEAPQDVRKMMSEGKSFFDITQHLVETNRAFSDNAAANLGWSIVTDPLNFIPIAKPFSLAKQASRLAKVEAAAFSEAEQLFSRVTQAGKASGKFAIPGAGSIVAKNAEQLGRALRASRMGEEDIAFLERWRVGAALYDATLGKLGSKFDSLVTALQPTVFMAASKALKDAPKNTVEGIAALGRKDLADNLAKSYGRGLSQTLVFSISKLFTRSTASVAEAEADYVLKVVAKAKRQAELSEKAGKSYDARAAVIEQLRTDEIIFGTADEANKFLDEIWTATDAERRAARRRWIEARTNAEVARVGQQAAGDYRTVERVGGVRRSDATLEAQSHLAEGAFKFEGLSPERQRQLFIEKGSAAISGNGREAVSAAIGGATPVTSPESIRILEQLWDQTISKMDDASRARHIQTMEIAAYGNQATNAAVLRSAIAAIRSGNAAKFTEITGQQIPTKRFNAIREILQTPEGSKLVRLNLVRSDTLTKERLEALIKALDESPEGLAAADLSVLPEELVASIRSAGSADAVAVAISNYFPDLSIMVGAAEKTVAKELSSALDDMLKGGHYVTLANPEELATLSKVLEAIAPGASKSTIAAMEAGRYTIGFAPESGVIQRSVVRATGGSVDVVSEHISPFLDSTEHLLDSALDITADSFARSGIRRLADRWLTPIPSKIIEKQQLENAIRVVASAGGNEGAGRRLFAAINELSLKSGKTPRALAMDENALRDAMSKAVGAEVFEKMLAKNGGDPRRVLMRMYLGTRETVGATQAFTGALKVKIPQLAILTDYIYPTLKFKLNPVFYFQEMVESPFFNRLRAIERTMTAGAQNVKYGWTRNLPFVRSRVGQKLGLSQEADTVIDADLAELVLGAPNSALRAELDIGHSVILLQGSEAAKIAATTAGQTVERGLIASLKGNLESFYRTLVNPYPMKEARRNWMAMSMALDRMSADIKFKFPEQWVAATKIYGTKDPRTVMIRLLQDAKSGYLYPVRAIDSARPRNFAFANPGSLKLAEEARSAAGKIVDDFGKGNLSPEQIADLRVRALQLKDLVDESIAAGNDMFDVVPNLDKIIAAEAGFERYIPKLGESAAESLKRATENINDFSHLRGAISMHYPESLRGFSLEKISASLARHRAYGTDFPGLERVIGKLRSGVKPADLSADDIRALRFGVNTLMDIHGPEEILLGAFREVVKDTTDAANRIHFYNPKRTALERTLNHPYLGYYPLSYMVGKVVPEFARAAFVKLPFTNRTRPFAGYEMVREARDHIAMQSEIDPEFGDFITKSDIIFFIKQMFPAVPGDISVGGPRWLNKSLEQLDRSQRPAVGNRPQAQFDPGYVMRSLADQAATQSAYGVLERTGGVVSEVWDWFEGVVPWNESKKP